MTGQELAAKLRSLGVAEIKSHMTAMDEFLLLRVEGLLGAHDLHRTTEPAAPETELKSLGLRVRKKKKKKKVEPAAPPGEPEEPAEVETAVAVEGEAAAVAEVEVETAPEVEIPSPTEPEAPAETAPPAEVEEVEVQPEIEEAPVETVAAEPAPIEEVAPEPPAVQPASTAEVTAETAPVATEEEPPAVEAEPPAEPPESIQVPAAETAPVAAEEEPAEESPAVAVEPEVEATPEPEAPPELVVIPETPAETLEPAALLEGQEPEPAAVEIGEGVVSPEIVRPSAKRRTGKVVGFVDLSKIQTTAQRRPDSRRLRSKDDVTPDVRPTLGHDRSRALMRGDHGSRGQLTAAQLREREAGRFLRRGRPQPGAGRGRGDRGGRRSGSPVSASPHAGGSVRIEAPITIKKLAESLSLKANQLVFKAMTLMGQSVNINKTLDEETAQLLAQEFSVILDVHTEIEAEEALLEEIAQKRSQVEDERLTPRPPVVAFLGHVDHGKTTLLDTIRESHVIQDEHGGITQHIGAYQVQTEKGQTLTIVDTPGHEAFSSMRERGAQAVDVTVLVIAADDGVMPSTLEAIKHANNAETPIVVALNKCDKPEAMPEKVKTELAGRDLIPEEWGGQTAVFEISALKNEGIGPLLDKVCEWGEVLELSCLPEGPAKGMVLEAEIQEGKGKVAYLLVQDGTLKPGDIILAGEGYGRVRSIHDDRGRAVPEAGASSPVEVSGLSELPGVGDAFYVVESLAKAKEVSEERARKNRAMSLAERRSVTVETLQMTLGEAERKTIDIVVKADQQGTLQAIEQQLDQLKHEEVEVQVLHAGLGTVTESDVDRASTVENPKVVAFHVGVNDKARQAAERAGAEIISYRVIYELIDDLRALMESSLAPEYREEVTAHIEIKVIFKSSKFGTIAGCQVIDGTVKRDHRIRVTRDDEVIHTTALAGLRREKDDVREVREGFECGVTLRDFQDYREGDILEAYKVIEVKRLLKI